MTKRQKTELKLKPDPNYKALYEEIIKCNQNLGYVRGGFAFPCVPTMLPDKNVLGMLEINQAFLQNDNAAIFNCISQAYRYRYP